MSVTERSHESEDELEERKREDFFAVLDLKKKSVPSSPSGSLQHNHPRREDAYNNPLNGEGNELGYRSGESGKDSADIQSIMSVTSPRGQIHDLCKSPPQASMMTADCGVRFDAVAGEEEQQDCLAAEFRRMKLKGEFPCRLCSAVFPNLRVLKGHIQSHIRGSVGMFHCNICPYTNSAKTNLVRHVRTHNADRPYECALCNSAFTTKANCERHLRNIHSKLSREDVKKSIIYHPSEDPTNDPDLETKLQAQDELMIVQCDELKHKSRRTQSQHKNKEQCLIGTKQTHQWKKTQEAATMTNNLEGGKEIEDEEMSRRSGLDKERESNDNISNIDALVTITKNNNNTFPKLPTTKNQRLSDKETTEMTPVRHSVGSPVRGVDSTLDPSMGTFDLNFPIHRAQPPFNLHPNFMSGNPTLLPSSNMEEFRSRLQKELINNSQLSCGTTFDSIMASTAQRLQAINDQIFSDYSGGNPEVNIHYGHIKVKEEDEESELVIDEEEDTEEEATDGRQSKEETKDTFSDGNNRTGAISSPKDVGLASVSRLMDNATTDTRAFQLPSDKDEEGLLTGSNREGKNSGSDENK
jgi:hypothetical protein